MMCLVLLGGVWEPIVKWRTHMFTIFTPFFTLGPASTTLYSTNTLSHGLISSTTSLQHSTTLYSLRYSSTAFLQSTTSTTPLWSRQLQYDQTRVTPLVSWSFFCVLMPLNTFTKLPLPASVSVPAGAINPLAADESCLMRSQHTDRAAQAATCYFQ